MKRSRKSAKRARTGRSAPAERAKLPAERAKPRRPRRDAAETRAAILDAAEILFIEMGYAGASLRAIAARAHTNLASAHYHFGSKAGLLGELIHQRVAPANEQRARRLEALERENPNPSVEQIVEVFFSPLESISATVPRLMARLYGEPESLSQPLIEREFGHTFRLFLTALGRALPELDPDTLAWRLEFTIGAMIHLLAIGRPLSVEPAAEPTEEGIRQLLAFAVAGITDGIPRARENRT